MVSLTSHRFYSQFNRSLSRKKKSFGLPKISAIDVFSNPKKISPSLSKSLNFKIESISTCSLCQKYQKKYLPLLSYNPSNSFDFRSYQTSTAQYQSSNASVENEDKILSKTSFLPYKISSITNISLDTKIFRVAFPNSSSSLQEKSEMPVSSLLLVQGATDNDFKPYTPITTQSTKGYLELLVKQYPNGKVSGHLHSLKVGDDILLKGSFPKKQYIPNEYKRIGMIAGGTGITPCLQVIEGIFEANEKLKQNKNSFDVSALDTTEIHLVYCNKSSKDILMKDRLDELAKKYHNFHVFYMIDEDEPNWNHGIGYVTPDIITKKLPAPEQGSLIMVCGPPPFMKHVSGDKAGGNIQGELSGLLLERGFNADMVYKF